MVALAPVCSALRSGTAAVNLSTAASESSVSTTESKTTTMAAMTSPTASSTNSLKSVLHPKENPTTLRSLGAHDFATLSAAVMNGDAITSAPGIRVSRHKIAINILETLAAINRKHSFASLKLLLRLMSETRNVQGTREVYQKIELLGFHKNDANVIKSMVRVLIENGDSVQGMEFFQRLLRTDPSSHSYEFLIKIHLGMCNDVGVSAVLDMMRAAKKRIDMKLRHSIMEFYVMRSDVASMEKLLCEYVGDDKAVQIARERIQMQLFNIKGEYTSALDIARSLSDKPTAEYRWLRSEQLISYAGLSDHDSMWATVAQLETPQYISFRGVNSMAKSLGPVSDTAALDSLEDSMKKYNISVLPCIARLALGYANMGDVASVTTLLTKQESMGSKLTLEAHNLPILAHYMSNDIDNAVACAKSIDLKIGRVDIKTWTPVIAMAVKSKPELVDEIVSHVLDKNPTSTSLNLLSSARHFIARNAACSF
ncbi:hypothetical protein BASA83_007016 [Batrachochytrium salamandrivorans]|nr:hypothetical protein BASA83_007016 [Batrachochytrium salamandrivorans]